MRNFVLITYNTPRLLSCSIWLSIAGRSIRGQGDKISRILSTQVLRLFILHLLLYCSSFTSLLSQSILLFEDFESGDFAAKGWYDGFPDQRTMDEVKNGSYSYAGHFEEGALTSGRGRHLFTPTDKLYMSYWVKYSENYIGSGVPYHPHEWNVLTTKDWIYQGPSDTYLTLYVEQVGGRPRLALQDSKNVDPDCILLNNNSFVGCNGNFNTYPFTESRSVASCNGLEGDVDGRDCYASSGNTHGYYSSRAWRADSVYFRNTPGPYYKNDWHFIETYFEMNTIEGGIGIPNGKIRYWYDGQTLISSDSILFRTGIHPDMKFNQLFYGPYIGVGSPVDQTWWIDDLTLADGILSTALTDPDSDDETFKIYPNPSNGVFTVEILEEGNLAGEYHLEIMDQLGKSVYAQNLTSKRTSFAPQIVAGIYFVAIKNSSGKKQILKIIKQ